MDKPSVARRVLLLTMDEQAQHAALLAALTTEHFVLQSATSTTYTEASAGRSGRLFALTDVLEPRQRW